MRFITGILLSLVYIVPLFSLALPTAAGRGDASFDTHRRGAFTLKPQSDSGHSQIVGRGNKGGKCKSRYSLVTSSGAECALKGGIGFKPNSDCLNMAQAPSVTQSGTCWMKHKPAPTQGLNSRGEPSQLPQARALQVDTNVGGGEPQMPELPTSPRPAYRPFQPFGLPASTTSTSRPNPTGPRPMKPKSRLAH